MIPISSVVLFGTLDLKYVEVRSNEPFLCLHKKGEKKDDMLNQSFVCREQKTDSGCRIFSSFAGLLLLGFFFSLNFWLPAAEFPLLTLSLCHIATG